MKLVCIADLVGTDVARLRADMRSRTADGELMHEHTAAEGPRMGVLKTVTFRTIKLATTGTRNVSKFAEIHSTLVCHSRGAARLNIPRYS